MGFNIGAVALRLSAQSTLAPSHNPAGWAAHAAHGFLAALEAGRPRPGCRQGWVLRGPTSWPAPGPLLAVFLNLAVRGALPSDLTGARTPPWGPALMTSSDPITCPRPHLQAHHTGAGFNVGIWGDTIQTIAFWPLGPQNSCPSHMRGTLIPSLFGLTPCLLPSVGRQLRLRGSGRAFSPGGSARIRLDVSLGWGGAPSTIVSSFLGPHPWKAVALACWANHSVLRHCQASPGARKPPA